MNPLIMVRLDNKRVADKLMFLTEQCFFADFMLVSNELKYNALYLIV